jgi:hypothetical protein
MSLSVQWWQSSSVLNLIGTIATVLAFAGGIWAALYASRPRRALTYSATMRPPDSDEQKKWVEYALTDEDERERAAIVNFILRGSGRLDVSASVFDNGLPIEITADKDDAPIRSEVGFAHRRDDGRWPEWHPSGNTITIGPGRIGRNQILVYTWITVPKNPLISEQGREPKVAMASALVDTRLRRGRRNIWIRLGVLAGVTALIFGLWYGWLGLAIYLSSGQAHTSLVHLASEPFVLIALLPPLILATIQLLRPYRDSQRARRAVIAAAATKDVGTVQKDDVYFKSDGKLDEL